jgi:cytidylate kinase
METHPEIDHEIDDGLKALSELDKFLIIDSRMAWHFTQGTFKVYLSTDIETSAIRIMSANRDGEHAMTLDETVKDTRARRSSEKKRYMEQYGVDIKDLSNYDLVLDTTYATPTEVADCLISSFEAWQKDKTLKALYVCPERLKYPDDAADDKLVSEYALRLELGQKLPPITVTEREGEFYITSGLESALAYSFNMSTFIPAVLVEEEVDTKNYTKMKNSL